MCHSRAFLFIAIIFPKVKLYLMLLLKCKNTKKKPFMMNCQNEKDKCKLHVPGNDFELCSFYMV